MSWRAVLLVGLRILVGYVGAPHVALLFSIKCATPIFAGKTLWYNHNTRQKIDCDFFCTSDHPRANRTEHSSTNRLMKTSRVYWLHRFDAVPCTHYLGSDFPICG